MNQVTAPVWGLSPAGLIKDHKEYFLGQPWDASTSVQIAIFNMTFQQLYFVIFSITLSKEVESPTQSEIHQSFHPGNGDYNNSTVCKM